MKMTTKITLFLLLFVTLPIFALSQEIELNPVNELIAWLSPIIVWVVGQIIKLTGINIRGSVMLIIVVPILSFLTTFITSKLDAGDAGFWMQFAYGLAAVFVDQVKKKITEEVA